ncbi:MAG: hypothetical protein IJM40_01120, partial [Synergistaceae bacterium]|nr:hypothetical protein [Synergistaceae bacterium]
GAIKIEFNGEEGQTRITQENSDDFLYMLMPARFSPQDIMEDGGYSGFLPGGEGEEEDDNSEENGADLENDNSGEPEF